MGESGNSEAEIEITLNSVGHQLGSWDGGLQNM
jgi:hypothetical protein